MRTKEEIKKYDREYSQRPERKARRKELSHGLKAKAIKKEYNQKNKESIRKWLKEYKKIHKEELKKERKEYNQKPEIKKRKKEYSQKPENKKKRKEYRQRIEINVRIKEYHKEYNQKLGNKKRIRKYQKNKNKTDKNYNIKKRLRSLLLSALKKYTKTGKVKPSKKYGINWAKVIKHLKPFPEDISLYHIDHRKPLCSFNFINGDGSTNLEEIKKAFAPENHQWLTIEENLSKGKKIIKQIILFQGEMVKK